MRAAATVAVLICLSPACLSAQERSGWLNITTTGGQLWPGRHSPPGTRLRLERTAEGLQWLRVGPDSSPRMTLNLQVTAEPSPGVVGPDPSETRFGLAHRFEW